MKTLLALVVVLSVTGCQWVKTTHEGQQVALVKRIHVTDCKEMGETTSKVKSKVGILERSKRKVADELVNLAKNEAATIGGDSIVPKAPIRDGSQTFTIYQCNK